MIAAMDRTTALFPAYSASGVAETIRAAFANLAVLLFGNTPFSGHTLEADIRALIAPQLTLLVHQRAKLAPERWTKTLDACVGRTFFWNGAAEERFNRLGRRKLCELVDTQVAEALRQAAEPQGLPSTSRFDSAWAD
ncbi:MAG: hypothetical protein JO261_10915 [Alphaproteobacteria bacterium]|nr:hypothetical protein [Alphaproteobacteria bacterium]MBV9694197.1 hypothetical protein [Alphaproteobacteria bacterium]